MSPRAGGKSGTATRKRAETANGSKAVQPKLGARAARRVADLEKEIGKKKAKEVLDQATATAVGKDDRIIRLEYLFAAQGIKMPAHAKAHYGKKDLQLGTFETGGAAPKSERGKAGRGNAETTAAAKGKSASVTKPQPRGDQSQSKSDEEPTTLA